MHHDRKILRIDLTSEKVSTEPLPDEWRRKFIGGEGINDYLLFQHFLKADINCDPTGPENVLIMGLGPLGATGYGPGSKMKWTFKSPLTNAFGDGSSGGFLGANMRWSGYDHVVITGKARHPVYLWINDDNVELRDARNIWGKDTLQTDDMVREDTGDEKTAIACIGIGGENGVRYAPIINSRNRSGAKVGGGCVMGSKNLKAIAVRGTKPLGIHDKAAFFEACDALTAVLNQHPQQVTDFIRHGTHLAISLLDKNGWLSFRNSQGWQLPGDRLTKLNHKWYANNIKVAEEACSPGCVIGCGGLCVVKGNESPSSAEYAGAYERLEFTALGCFGAACDIADMPAVTYLWHLCNVYDIDAMEIGVTSGFLMELWQRGIITPEDTLEWFGEPVALEWGNYKAVEKIILSVAHQNNKIGEMLKYGMYKAGETIGRLKNMDVIRFAPYGKFGVGHIEDMRNSMSWATGFAVSSRGCDHLKAYCTPDRYFSEELSMMYFGRPESADPVTLTLKGAGTAAAEWRQALANCLGVCSFVINRSFPVPGEVLSRAFYAVTGMKLSPEELTAAGRRTVNLEKAFNSRLGYDRKDDRLCERWTKEERDADPGKGWKGEDFLPHTLDEYYEWNGWDKKTSRQRRVTLEELEMPEIADALEKDGVLA